MYMGTMLFAAILCAVVGICCVVLSLLVAIRDRRDKRRAAHKKLTLEQEAHNFSVNARAAEQKRMAMGARLRDGEEKAKALATLGLAENREWSRDEIMGAWRAIVKSSHPDASRKDGRLSIERATAARDLLIKK